MPYYGYETVIKTWKTMTRDERKQFHRANESRARNGLQLFLKP